MIVRILCLLIALSAAPAYAAPGVAVVQSAAPTSNGGTQDFTSSGFGTPVCAMFFVGYGTVNGTVVDHAMYGVGFSDFTNHVSLAHADEDAQADTDTGANTDTAAALITLLNSSQAVDGTATAATITDGVRLTWADAPPAAYLVTAVLFNSSVVANCTAGTFLTSTTVDGTASASGFGWQPDIVFGTSRNNQTTAHARTNVGIAINDGSIVQYSIGQNSQGSNSVGDLTQVIRNDRLLAVPVSGGSLSSHELTSFDVGGFTLTTRDSTSANRILYLALKLQTGVAAKLIACDSPTSTGSKSCTGAGWTPQAGIFLQTEATAINTYSTVGESYGLSAFTASQSSTSSIWADDGAATSDTTSVTDSKAVRMRRDSADFLTATLTQFQSDGVDLNYSVVDGTARLGALLLFQSTDSSSSSFFLRRRVGP